MIFYSAALDKNISQPAFLIFQIIWWILLIIISFKIRSTKLAFWIMIFIGLVYLFEFHHLIEAFQEKGYYPGMVTALGFPLIAFFYWKEFIKGFKN